MVPKVRTASLGAGRHCLRRIRGTHAANARRAASKTKTSKHEVITARGDQCGLRVLCSCAVATAPEAVGLVGPYDEDPERRVSRTRPSLTVACAGVSVFIIRLFPWLFLVGVSRKCLPSRARVVQSVPQLMTTSSRGHPARRGRVRMVLAPTAARSAGLV